MRCGTRGSTRPRDIQAFLARAHVEQLHRVFEQRADVEVRRHEIQLAGFNLGEIEDVVDHVQAALRPTT